MKADLTRNTFYPAKRYNAVRMQQGRVQLDADWNEQVDIQLHRERTTIGQHGLGDLRGMVGTVGFDDTSIPA